MNALQSFIEANFMATDHMKNITTMNALQSFIEENFMATDHMKYITEDVIILILVTLPVKPLMRFKCVCKSWYDLIRSPKFIEMHLLYTKHKKNECILIQHMNAHRETILSFLSYESLNVISPHRKIPPLNFYSDDSRLNVSWPCNGLLLCVSCDSRNLLLCNPATREFKFLPPHPIPYQDEYRGNYLEVFKFGLGFDSNKNEYKAFVEVSDEDYDDYGINLVYNMSSNLWRQVNPDEINRYSNVTQGIPCNGALHWIIKRHEIDYNIIVCFDLRNEVFQDIKLPQAISQSYHSNNNLTIVNDCLAFFTFTPSNFNFESKFVDIWVMNEYNVVESWTKLFSISSIQNTLSYWYPRLLWKNEAILNETEIWGEKRKLVLRALDTHNMTDTILMYDSYMLHGVMLYKESLVSIK